MTTAFLGLNFSFLEKYYTYFIDGAITTLQLALLTILFGSILGVLLALMRLSKIFILRFLASTYVEIIRGTPFLVQLFIIHYSLPIGLQWFCRQVGLPENTLDFPVFVSGIITLSINSAAYVAEIFRAGIQAVDKGQMEAARSLGMTSRMSMRYIILPQAVRNILPALGNEFVVIIKESSQVMVIGLAELMYSTNIVRGATYISFEPLLVAAAMYFVMTFTLSKLLGLVERRMKASD